MTGTSGQRSPDDAPTLYTLDLQKRVVEACRLAFISFAFQAVKNI